MSEKHKVLVIDDDLRLLSSLRLALDMVGFEVITVDSAAGARPIVNDTPPALIVLDVSMPGLDGISYCRELRKQTSVPILMLTARDEIHDRVAGLEAGADDYLLKPFALEELVARIRALLRRTLGLVKDEQYAYRDLRVDGHSWQARFRDERLELTSTEFLILHKLMSDPSRVFSRGELLQIAWASEVSVESNTVDVHISNIRKKLEVVGARDYIRTVRRAGYSLSTD